VEYDKVLMGWEHWDSGGHFWHDAVIETKSIALAQWILPNRDRSCNGGT